MEQSKNLTLTEWYVKQEEKNVATHPGNKEKFLDLLKNHPEKIVDYFKGNLDGIAMTAIMSGEVEGVFVYDIEAQALEILNALREAFLGETSVKN